jgi:hypothetical protein
MDDIDPAFKILAALVVVYLILGIMVGGLIVSQALTLFTTPVVYLYLDRLSNAFARWGRSSNPNHDADLDAHGPVKQAAE